MQSNVKKYRLKRVTPAAQIPGPSPIAGTRTLSNVKHGQTNSVNIKNLPGYVNQRDVISLFNTLVGEVQSFQDIKDAPTSPLVITFFERDSAIKALSMNGYNVAGFPLVVSTVALPINVTNKKSQDDRRNFYVVGLPSALTNNWFNVPDFRNEFTAAFSAHGTVLHTVILATVDKMIRRRGFVVMSSHQEAQRAMLALTETSLRGSCIDVSWPVIQRSQGFLDGGDRSTFLKLHSTQSGSRSSKLREPDVIPSDPSECSRDHTSVTPARPMLVSNLPTYLFSHYQDLHPLFLPFGELTKLEIVHAMASSGTISVLVQYSCATAAQEAIVGLSGLLYGDRRVEVRYVEPPPTSTILNSGQCYEVLSDALGETAAMSRRSATGHGLSQEHLLRSDQGTMSFSHVSGGCNLPTPMSHASLSAMAHPSWQC